MNVRRKTIIGLSSLILAAMPLGVGTSSASAAPAPVGDLAPDCVPQVDLNKSETYGIMAVFGAQCDRKINVNIKGRVFIGGKLKKTSKLKKCRNMKQNAYCQSYLTASNPRGKNKVRVEVTVDWWLAEESSKYSHRVMASTTQVM
ncbi:hypothetical protein KIH74_33270 [Kineosporia sp. J2-2]|uniref:Secreted protein n=1 Tax=Kineosporia corallincola TaxID=2835133 RepID=A0ABS5TSW3_9ACTN|nr:hypothetical protein [Kineosporia corallincola]MBT0773863.1 hypothetical protein [Kineosporia corallincola]